MPHFSPFSHIMNAANPEIFRQKRKKKKNFPAPVPQEGGTDGD